MASHEGDLSFEEGWSVLQEAVDKLIRIIEEGVHTPQFTTEEYLRFYTAHVISMFYVSCLSFVFPAFGFLSCDLKARTAFNMSWPNPFDSESKLYGQYMKTFDDYITSKVLPSLRVKDDEILLQELVKRWKNHKVMTRWLARFLQYLDRYFVNRKKLPTLKRTSYLTFYTLVYGETNDQVRDAVISMIDREREGEQIDKELVKNVLDIYVEMAEDSMKYYEKDFEDTMLKSTAAFYSARASIWIYNDYMLKVDGCLKEERDRVSCYLQDRSQIKLLEVVRHELLTVYASKLEEMKQLDDTAA